VTKGGARGRPDTRLDACISGTLELAIPLPEEAAGGQVEGVIGDTDPLVALLTER
jgi:hypothetical protein